MTTPNVAAFTINGTPSEDPTTGDRKYVATHSESLFVTLEQSPASGVVSVTYEVYDANDSLSPLASGGLYPCPALTWVSTGTAKVTPFDKNGTEELVAPSSGIHSWLIRATATTLTGPVVFERLVYIESPFTPKVRKTVPAETQQGTSRGWSDVLNDMVEALAYDFGLTLLPGTIAGQVLVWSGTAWGATQVDLSNTNAVTNQLAVTNMAFSPGAGDAGKVLTATGAGTVAWVANTSLTAPIDPTDDGKVAIASGGDLTYSLLTSSHLASGAAIAPTQLATGGANQVLWSNGSANSWTGAPIVTSVAASSHIALGTNPATVGNVRLPHGGTIYGRDSTNTFDRALVQWGTPVTDRYYFGSNDVAIGYFAAASSITLLVNGASILSAGTSYPIIETASMRWRTTGLLQPIDSATAGYGVVIAAGGSITASQPGGYLDLKGGTAGSGGVHGMVRVYNGPTQVAQFDGTQLALFVPNITWAGTVSTPKVYQGDAAASTHGQTLTVRAQNAVTAAYNGGAVSVEGGAPGAGGLYGSATIKSNTTSLQVQGAGVIYAAVSGGTRFAVTTSEFAVYTATFDFGAAVTNPIFKHTESTGATTDMTILAQSTSSGAGANLKLWGGSGTTTNGNVQIGYGATTVAQFGADLSYVKVGTANVITSDAATLTVGSASQTNITEIISGASGGVSRIKLQPGGSGNFAAHFGYTVAPAAWGAFYMLASATAPSATNHLLVTNGESVNFNAPLSTGAVNFLLGNSAVVLSMGTSAGHAKLNGTLNVFDATTATLTIGSTSYTGLTTINSGGTGLVLYSSTVPVVRGYGTGVVILGSEFKGYSGVAYIAATSGKLSIETQTVAPLITQETPGSDTFATSAFTIWAQSALASATVNTSGGALNLRSGNDATVADSLQGWVNVEIGTATNYAARFSPATATAYASASDGDVLTKSAANGSTWSKLAAASITAGADNTVLWSTGGASSWTGTPTVTSVAASSHFATGAIPATVGAVRLSNNTWIYSRNAADTGNLLLIGQNSGTIQIGDSGVSTVQFSSSSIKVPEVVGVGSVSLVIKSNSTVPVGTGILLQAYATGAAAYQTGLSTTTTAGNYTTVEIAPVKQNVFVFGATATGTGQGVLSIGAVQTAPTTSATGQALIWNESNILKLQGHTSVQALGGAPGAAGGFTASAGATSFFTSATTILYLDNSIVNFYKPLHIYGLATGLIQYDAYGGAPDTVIPQPFTIKGQNAVAGSTGSYAIGGALRLKSGTGTGAGASGAVEFYTGETLLMSLNQVSTYAGWTVSAGMTGGFGFYANNANQTIFFQTAGTGGYVYNNTNKIYWSNTSAAQGTFQISGVATSVLFYQDNHADTPRTWTMQAANVVTGIGSDFAIKSGTGSVRAGNVYLYSGSNLVGTFSDTTVKTGPLLAGGDQGISLVADTGIVYSAVGALASSGVPARWLVKGFGTSGTAYSLMTVNGSSIAGLWVTDENTVVFGGSATQAAKFSASYNGSSAVLTTVGTSMTIVTPDTLSLFLQATGVGAIYYTGSNHFYSGYIYGAASVGLTIASNYNGTAGQKLRLLAYASTGGWQECISAENITGSYAKIHIAPADQNIYAFGAADVGGGQGVLSVGSAAVVPTTSAANQALIWNDAGGLGLQAHAAIQAVLNTTQVASFGASGIILGATSGYNVFLRSSAGLVATGQSSGFWAGYNGTYFLQTTQLATSRNIVSLFRTTAVTATEVPTGSGVLYMANANPNPSSAPSGGCLLWSNGGYPAMLTASGDGIQWELSFTTSAGAGTYSVPDTANGFMKVTLNGTGYKIALYAES